MIAFERIKELAKQKKLSLIEVNDKAGLGTRSIYHWNKTQPSNSNLAAVAKVLGTTTDYLNGLTDDPDIPGKPEVSYSKFENQISSMNSKVSELQSWLNG